MAAPIPHNETARLRALHAMHVFGAPHSMALDRVTRLAARAFNVPMAMISLIDSDRLYFKSRVGLTVDELPREHAVCPWVVYLDDELVIPCATLDPRFRDNRFVAGPPFLRFYAGVPVRSADGFPLGAFCIADSSPRSLSQGQRHLLREMGDCVEVLLDVIRESHEATARSAAIEAESMQLTCPPDRLNPL